MLKDGDLISRLLELKIIFLEVDKLISALEDRFIYPAELTIIYWLVSKDKYWLENNFNGLIELIILSWSINFKLEIVISESIVKLVKITSRF